MTVEVGRWSSILAGQSLLQVSETKQNNMGTVNKPPRSLASARRRAHLLHLLQDVVEPMISKGATATKKQARTPRGKDRRIIAHGGLLLRKSEAISPLPSCLERSR